MAAPKVALITASSAGLGAACVRALAPHYRIVVNYHSRREKAEALIKEATTIPPHYSLPASSPRFHAIQADCSSRPSIQSLVAETVSVMGSVDLIISNAGYTRLTTFADLDDQVADEDWDKCFTVNVKSHLWLLYAAKPYLEKSEGGGSFVAVASVAGVKPGGSSLPYSVTKAAEIHLVKGLATICGKKVRCNSVSPGLMMTEWGQKFPQSKVDAAIAKTAIGELATPEDVAEQIKAIAMNKSMTGQNIIVDGGAIM